MTDLDTRLTEILSQGIPGERDPVFRIDVLMRLERARFRRRMAALASLAIIVTVVAAPNARAIGGWLLAHSEVVLTVAVVELAATAALLSRTLRGRWI